MPDNQEDKDLLEQSGGVYELSDLDIVTVGLVTRGANQEEFYLTKQDEKGGKIMPQEEVVIDKKDEEVVEETLITKLKQLFIPRDEVDELLKADPEPEPEPEPEPVAKDDAIPAAVLDRLDAIEEQHEERLAELTKANEATQAKLEKAEQEAATEREKREQREWLEKATQYQVLPVGRDELGKHLHAFAKALDQEQMDWLTELLKATDATLFDAGLYYEKGTSQAAEQLPIIQKVQKDAEESGDLRAALLNLPAAEQRQLLKALQGGEK